MITDYFRAPDTLARMRASCIGAYLDDLTNTMASAGFAPLTITEHVRSAVQLAEWAKRRGVVLSRWDESLLIRFRKHLIRRGLGKCDRVVAHATQLLALLRMQGVIAQRKPTLVSKCPAVLEEFASWMVRHRGITSHTVYKYNHMLRVFVGALGDDPATYDVARIRGFVIEHLGRRGRGETRIAVTAIRAFLRFLVAEGRVVAGTEFCVPTVPQWRLSSLPRYLEAVDVERVIASCDLSTGHGLRDHAVLLLLSRLGLRAGDIVAMMLGDIDWIRGTLRVRGKSNQEALLPLPQRVGDALLAYLEQGRPRSECPRVFLTVVAPTRPFASSAAVSDIVRFALVRAGISDPPTRGAHLLRHSAATAMLRAGSSLDTIAAVLRHRSTDTTAHYAKVDVGMLQEIAQPWPGGASC